MSTFKITPEDLGRTALARDGKTYVIYGGDKDGYAYATHKGSCDSNGRMYYSDGTSPSDLVAWADEASDRGEPDQNQTQPRPKDLRDEFAMAALQGLTADPLTGYAYENFAYCVSKRAYEIADAMMKSREGK